MAEAMQSQTSGAGVANPEAGFNNAEARRTLDRAVYSATGGRVTVQLPRDTVIKRMSLRITAIHDVTYAAGSPTVSEMGTFQRLCDDIEVVVNGNRTVKSVKPHLLRMHQLIAAGCAPRRAYQLSAATPTVTRADREWFGGVLAYAATTEFMLHNEQVPLSFEMPWGYLGSRYDTELDIRDVSSADIKFGFQAIANLQRDGVGATVTYGNVNIFVTPQILENRARPRPKDGDVLFDYVESTIARTISGQQTGYQVDLQTGNYLAAVGIFCRNGDTNKSPAENLLRNLALKVNSSNTVQGPVDHQQLQDDNVARFGISDYLGLGRNAATIASAAGDHPMKGFAFMNLLRNGDWNTAINTSRGANVDTVKLEFDTPSSSSGLDLATYTNPLEVILHTHEIKPFIYRK